MSDEALMDELLSNLVAEPFDPCCSGCGFEWAWDDLVDGFCPDCVVEDVK